MTSDRKEGEGVEMGKGTDARQGADMRQGTDVRQRTGMVQQRRMTAPAKGRRGCAGMKMGAFLFSLFCLVLTFAACSKKEESVEYYDIRVESQIMEDAGENQWLLGRQYYQGEPVSLIAEKVNAEDGTSLMDVYLQPAGKERQLLMSGVSRTYRSTQWYLDGEGNCLIPQTDGVIRLGKDGNMLYHCRTDGWVRDICGLESGRIILLMEKDKNYRLEELDPVTGTVSKIENVSLDSRTKYIGASGDRLMLLDAEGFWLVDLKKGTKTLELPFAGTFYTLSQITVSDMKTVVDFQVEGNEARIIWSSGMEEQLARVNVDSEKEIITFRGAYIGSRLKAQIHLFNQSNDNYHVVLEENGEGTSRSDFVTETNLRLAAGKGADIICENALSGDVYSMIENGIFADLTPLMEASGIRKEDYFPAAFAQWEQDGKCYGIAIHVFM